MYADADDGDVGLGCCENYSMARLRKPFLSPFETSTFSIHHQLITIIIANITIMTAHTEDELKALKVVDLKHLLSEANLPTSGRKEELIARLLSSEPAEASTSEPVVATDNQDSTAAPASDATKTSEKTVSSAAPTAAPASSVESAKKTAPMESATAATTSEEKTASSKEIDEEIEKRKSRAARFGVPYVDSKSTTPKPKTNTVQPPKAAAVPAKPTSKKVAEPEPAKVLDPVEEEKKRKRLEKFGPVRPAADEKKAKMTV